MHHLRLSGDGKFDQKQGPVRMTIGGLDRPVVIRHDSMNNRKPEAGSRSFS